MDSRLKTIINPDLHFTKETVNWALLQELTTCHALSFADELDWRRIRYLTVIGTKTYGFVKELEGRSFVDSSGGWLLLIGVDSNQIQCYIDNCPEKLEYLHIDYTAFSQLCLPPLKMLRELYIRSNSQLCKIFGLDHLSALQVLDLSMTRCDFPLDLSPYPMLRKLSLCWSDIKTIRLNCVLEELQECGLYSYETADMEFLTNCPSLETLELWRNPIQRLPEGIRRMKKLRKLLLWDLSLKELPDWLPELKLPIVMNGRNPSYGIDLWGTTVKDVDMSIFTQSQEVILDWFRLQKDTKKGEPLNEIKVVFLGDGGTGKSLTVARLLNDGALSGKFDGGATPGIDIKERNYLLSDGRTVQIHFWDFGGQEILHSMHRIFLTDRTLYVLMINARNNNQDDKARYWLHNVSCFAHNSPVLLVLNQIDQNPNASINERSLMRQYPNLKQVIRLSALRFNQETFNREFTDKLLTHIASFPSIGTIFPPTWKKAMDKIRSMKGNYIRGSEYSRICRDSGVDGHKLRLDLLKWFNDIGVSFCCGKSARLSDYVVLKPEWITNAIYTIIWNKCAETANGMVDRDEIYQLLISTRAKQIHSDMTYKLEDVDFILNITRQFRLSFPMDDSKEFVPMLCKENALPEVDDFLDDPSVIEFRMEYEYLPDNVIHRLMVDMRQDLVIDKVWLTGALLQQKYNGIDALIKSEGNVLSIHIRAADADHRAHTYLNTLRGALDVIHKDMGLKEPEMLVAYQEDGQVEYFPYEMVEGSRKNGVQTLYSRVFRRMIPIDDILNGTDCFVAQQKEKLLRDVAKACVQLLSDRNMTDKSEDERNDRLRDALDNMGYRVADQTHTGTGCSGKRAGSLDLQLRHNEDGSIWTNLEAMNLHSNSKSQLKYWDNHLDRLMGNYNGAGLPMLFLISYVDCSANRFDKLYRSYIEHINEYTPPKSEIRQGTLTEVPFRDGQYAYLRVCRCTYDLSGTPVMVYHYFAGFTNGVECIDCDSES